MNSSLMVSRVIRAAKLDPSLYHEIEHDASLNREALMVVIFVSLLGAVSALLSGLIARSLSAALLGAVLAVVSGVIGYYIWSYLTWFIGTRLFNGTAEPGELLRSLGYAYGVQALGLLSFIPCVGIFISLAAAIWALVAGIIAVREALNFDTGKAVITVVIGWVVMFVISLLIGGVVGLGVGGFQALTGG